MFLRALTAFLVLPGVVAGIIPAFITHFDPWKGKMLVIPGTGSMGLGIFLLLWCVRDFYVAGKGTLAPWDPPKRLVTVGLYRYSRNPMYVSVLTLLCGWALLFASLLASAYILVFFVIFHLRVVFYEEPCLTKQFGQEWEDYKSKVPRWVGIKSGKNF